jgi:hypothetical protein
MTSTVIVVGVIPTSVACSAVLVQSAEPADAAVPAELLAVVGVVAAADVLPPLLRAQLVATIAAVKSRDGQTGLFTEPPPAVRGCDVRYTMSACPGSTGLAERQLYDCTRERMKA